MNIAIVDDRREDRERLAQVLKSCAARCGWSRDTAVRTGDIEQVVKSFMEDPVTLGAHATEKEIRSLVKDMIAATRPVMFS